MPVISHPQLNPRAIRLKAEDDWHLTPTFQHPRRPRAGSRDDAIFSGDAILSGERLLLDVNFRPKISRRLTAPGPPRMTFQLAGKLFEPTVREDDQQFPSQIQDGGR